MFRLIAPVLIGTTLVVPSQAGGQWSTDPSNNLIVGYGLNPELCSDSAGGCFITYEQNTGYPRQLILHRLNRYGLKVWGGNGVQILGQLPEQWFANIAADGRGGVLVSYIDDDVPVPRPLPFKVRLRVQRVDSSGHLLWDSVGVRVSLMETGQGEQSIVGDGSGGCIIAWIDSSTMLRVQRIDNAGVRTWGDSGIVISTATQYRGSVVRSGIDNFIVAYGTLVKRLDLQGGILWNGQAINVGYGTRSLLARADGALVVYDGTGTSNNVKYVAQELDSSGNFTWTRPYVTVAESTIFSVFGYPLVNTTDGMMVVAWEKGTNSVAKLFTQRLSPDGTMQWPVGGVPVRQFSSTDNLIIDGVASDSGAALLGWSDLRGGFYSQKLGSIGQQLWNPSDVAVSIPPLTYVHITTDGNAGAIFAGFYQTDFSIRTQQVSRNGKLGEIITSVNEVNTTPPHQYLLFQNYPNPFNSSTIIRYAIPKQGVVVIELYNSLGQKLRTLVDGFHEPGSYQINLDAEPLASGVYFCILRVTGDARLRKLTILR